MDRIDQFRIFARVVEATSFTRAAQSLGLPRSTVSAAVLGLEMRLNARLLHRTTRKVSLTQDGRLFYERCLQLLADVAEVEDLFRPSAGPKGTLRIDAPGRIGRLIIAPALPGFLEQYPGVNITLGVTDRAVDLIADSVDCVVRVGPQRDSGLIARPIGALPLINVASPAYLARHGAPATPADLDGHFAVNYASPSGGRVEAWEWIDNGVQHARPMAARVTVNNAEASIACCLAGLGLIQIPAYDVARHLAAGELVEVMPAWRPEPLPIMLLYPDRRHAPHRLRLFADWLVALLRREALPPP
ncbi:LysR family transcriptional regulator [Camelimonas sp. ID_303_24]